MSDLTEFDLHGPLPTGTTVLEASAGTGKTYAIAALVTRFVAEGEARLEEMLVITFGRMASQELRERVREQLVSAERGLADPAGIPASDELVRRLADVADDERVRRHRRVLDALAAFDAATIATTHQFCQLVLRSLGVAGDEDPRVELVERIDELVVEVVDDLFLREYGDQQSAPLPRSTALALARAAVGDPQARVDAGNGDPERQRFTRLVTTEIERRKRKLGILTYDDLLSRLATALEAADAPARARMRARWKVVLVDEFQDTDPVQWDVLERAFVGHARLVLIGDPKQAIYAFRGGDIVTYLRARGIAGTLHTLPTNWRSDAPLVDALQQLTRGAALGHPDITVHPIRAHQQGSRLAGLPHPEPFRVRLVEREGFPLNNSNAVPIDDLRRHIAEDLADDIARLLDARPTFDGRELVAGDVAVLLFSLANAPQIQAALKRRGIPSVVNGGDNVLTTEAAAEWLALLEALEKPQFTGRIRSLALTSFVGLAPAQLDAGGDDLTDDLAERVRSWLDLFRSRGLAAVRDALVADGLVARVLSRPQGERHLTDLDHVGQVLHEVAHREGLGLAALLEWLRRERRLADKSRERTRRLDTDARAVQFVTLHGSKGLQYPIVYLPLAFNRSIWNGDEPTHLFHDEQGRRTLDISGRSSHPDARREDAGEELRLTYVGLTRAQAQVVAWWAPSAGAVNSGLSRLLFERAPDVAQVQDRIGMPSDEEARQQLERWQGVGAISLEPSRREGGSVSLPEPEPGELDHRRFTRAIDTEWRRTSYSGLIRAEEQVVVSEPEDTGTVDEDLPDELAEDDLPEVRPAAEPESERGSEAGSEAPPSPMEGLPAGATFGSLVHAVLEHADPQAADLRAELRRHVVEQGQWWSVDASPDDLADALLPMQVTSLGPLADGLRLVDLPLTDRLRELDFEFPLAGGEGARVPTVWLRQFAGVLREHLPADDPMRAYADRLESPSLGGQELRGYLSGSIDVVFRVPDASVPGGARFVVADYKTNRLGVPGEPITALDYTQPAMTEAMLHSHYPLQALLYSVVLHRYLRWRLGDRYDPDQHLGGILYLYVRGMCGTATPVVDGVPCGVFTWRPPAALVLALSDLLAGAAEGSAA